MPGPSTSAGSPTPGTSGVGATAGTSGVGGGKRNRDDELLSLLKEDMQLQREAEERRAAESRERMDRLFSLLEKMADNDQDKSFHI